jgi:UPF0716 protein FxsA
MFLFLLVAFLAIPIVEIVVLLEVADAIGGWETLGLMIVVSIVGAWLARYEGFVTLRRIREALDRGELPADELIDGGLILFASVLLLTPGFVTDVLGLLVIFPPTRAVFRAVVRRRFRLTTYRVRGPGGPGGPGGPDDVIDV